MIVEQKVNNAERKKIKFERNGQRFKITKGLSNLSVSNTGTFCCLVYVFFVLIIIFFFRSNIGKVSFGDSLLPGIQCFKKSLPGSL